VAAAPGHVEHVRQTLFDPLTPEQAHQLRAISDAIHAAVGNPPACETDEGCPGMPEPPLTPGQAATR
jgi:hypothetical protein